LGTVPPGLSSNSPCLSFSGVTHDLENTLLDLAYTFVDEYTLTLGSIVAYVGKLSVTTRVFYS